MRASVVLALALAACEPGGRSADIAIYGAVWTGDTSRAEAGALAIRGDSVLAVGDSAEIAVHVSPRTRVIVAGSGLVLPGFADDHVHFSDGGFQLGFVDLRDATSPEEFVRRIRAYAAKLKPGEWILGGTWDHERWPGAPLPRREWIDSVTPDNPVFIQRLDGHMGLANTRTLMLAGLSSTSREIAGARSSATPPVRSPVS